MANNSDCTDLSSDVPKSEPEDDPEVAVPQVPQVPPWKRTCKLSINERHAIFHELLRWRKDGDSIDLIALKRGALLAPLKKFKVNRRTVDSLWKRVKESMDDARPAGIDLSCQNGISGRKRKHVGLDEKIMDVPLNKRGTIRSLASQIGVPKTTVHRYFKKGKGKVHTSTVKPFLTQANMTSCINFCKAHVDLNSGFFNMMRDVVHIDEKWFYMNQNTRRYYLGLTEEEPERKVKSKRYGVKVMFLVAVARPR